MFTQKLIFIAALFIIAEKYSSDGKESVCSAGDPGLIPWLESSLEKRMATTPVFLPAEFHGQRSPAGYRPWVAKSWT